MEELELIVQRMIDTGEPEENIKAVIEEYYAGKQTDPVSVEAETGSKEDTASNSEDGLSAWQSIKNSFSNAGEQIGDIGEFWLDTEGDGGGARSSLDVATNAVYAGIFGQDALDNYVKEKGKDSWLTQGLGSDYTLESIKKHEKEKEETKQTLGIIESVKKGDIGGTIAGGINAVTSMIGSVAYGAGTLGTGFFMDYVAENYIEFNKLKAENLGVSFEELIKSGEADHAIPVGMGAVSTGLELVGLGTVLKAGKGAIKGSSSTGLIGSANKYLAEKLVYSSSARKAMSMLGAGSTEFTTEILQHASDEINREFGSVAGTDKEAEVGKAFIDAVTSQEGLEAGIQGFLGGGGVVGGSYSAKAMSTIRSTVDGNKIDKNITELSNLRNQYKNATDKSVKEGIQIEIDKKESEISDSIRKGNEIYNSLNSDQISEIESLTDLADAAAFKITDLNKKLRRGDITQSQYDSASVGFKNQYKKARQSLIDMNLEKNIEFAKKEAESRGLKFRVYETTKSLQKAMNRFKTSKENKQEFKDNKGNIHGFSIGNEIFINKEVAREQGAINVGAHEVLHPIFNKLIGDVKNQGKYVKQFRKSMTSAQRSFVDNQMKERGYTSEDQYNTEYINVFSDALRNKQINYDKNTFEKIGDAVLSIIKPKGYENASFENGKEVYNFIKEYDKSIQQGKLTESAKKALGDIDLSDAKLEGVMQQSKQAVKEVNDIYNANSDKQVAGFEIADKYRGMAESVFNALKEGSNYTQNQKEVFEGKKEDMLAMMLYDKIPSQKEDSKARNVVGLVQDFESKKQKYNNVAAYVNTFFKERSKEVFKYFSKDAVNEGLTKEDGTLKKSVSNKANEISNVDQGKEARKLSSFDKLMKGKESFVDNTMKKSIISKLTKNLKTAAFKGKFTAESITSEIKKLITQEIEKAVVKRMGKISKTKAGVVVSEEYKSFHSENFNAIVKALPVSVIKKKYFSLFEKKNIGREKTAQGNAIFEIKPTSKGKFGAYFTIGGYTTLRARQKSLANEISAELIKDQATILKQDVDFVSELAEVADMSGVQVTDLVLQTELESLANQFDRKKTEATKFDKIQFSQDLNNNQKEHLKNNLDKIRKDFNKNNLIPTKSVTKKILLNYIDENIISKKELDGLASSISKAMVKYNKDKFVKVGVQNIKFEDFVFEQISYDFTATNLIKSLNLDIKSFATAFRDPSVIAKARSLNIGFAYKMIDEKGVDGLINFLKIQRGHQSSSGKIGGGRNQVWMGNPDILEAINLHPDVYVDFEKPNKLTVIKDVKYKNKSIDAWKSKAKPTPQKSISREDAKKQYKQRVKEANEAWNTLIEYLTYIHANGTRLDFGVAMMSLKSNMSSMLKAAAPLEYYYVGKGFKLSELRYEHLIPTEYIVMKLTDHFYHKKININKLQDKYKVALIPKVMDANLNIQRQISMGKGWDENQHETKRYYDNVTLGFSNMFAIKSFADGKIYGESHVKAQFSKTAKIKADNFNKAMMNARNPNAPEKGISVFDFDDTIAQSNSKVLYILPDGKQGKINATEFALQSADLEAAGAIFDFSEFSKVIEGKKGPLFDLAVKRQDKFTSKDIFILTARPQDAAIAIHAFLKGMGLTIPINNITGLADGKASAKADWIIGKAAEGYNNFYFADDAYKNVEAVQKVLDIIDVKREVQLAKIQFSKDMGQTFNDIIQDTKGVASEKRFSKAAAESRGRDIGKWKFFLPASAEDFVGLLYNFLGKGKVGEKQMEFFNKSLVQPFARAMDELNRAKQAIATDFRALKKTYPEVRKMLAKITPYNNFTYDTAVRVYIWNKKGETIPGLSKTDIKRLVDIVENNSDLKDFADTLEVGVANNNYTSPSESWLVGNIASDLKDITDKVGRKQFLQEWIANKEVIFSKENLNKIEAIYGSNFREALEDMLYRMENGTNRSFGSNRLVNSFSNWVNNSVGAIMFFNMRSAILQTISFVNFVNWSDNNPLKFAGAILNVKQFSTDFVTLFNSDMLKQRRAGIGRDVNESEIAEAMSGARNKPKAILNYLLRIGFTPTQIADSFAISMGGAAFYRNRINTYLKQGMTQEQALDQAFKDFQETTEVSQQSSRPDMISQQQAGPLGRLILAFQNTPMQYTRLMKKAFKDLINGRGDAKTNLSKIVYYGVVQNIIFASMQSALFAMLFDDDDDEDKYGKKKGRIANTMTDSILRGSGLAGAGISTIKNVILKFLEQEEKGWNADHAYTVIEAANFSPPIGSKLRKMYSGIQTYKFNKDVIADRGLSLNNPAWQSAGNFVSAATNIPMDRAVNKYNNLRGAANNNNEAWQRIAMALGWSSWDVDAEIETGYKEYKAKLKKTQKRRKILEKRRNKTSNRQEILNKRREILRNRKK